MMIMLAGVYAKMLMMMGALLAAAGGFIIFFAIKAIRRYFSEKDGRVGIRNRRRPIIGTHVVRLGSGFVMVVFGLHLMFSAFKLQWLF